jgi:hypothetical protein
MFEFGARCTMKDKYHCLITENHNEDEPDLIECCMPYMNISRGIILYCSVYYTLGENIRHAHALHGISKPTGRKGHNHFYHIISYSCDFVIK